jgi:hypothetical protein
MRAVYSQLLTRVYSDGESLPVMLLVAQSGSQTGFLQIHRPETCYTASGYRLSALMPHAVQIGRNCLGQTVSTQLRRARRACCLLDRVGNQMPMSWKNRSSLSRTNPGIIPDAISLRLVGQQRWNAARAAMTSLSGR